VIKQFHKTNRADMIQNGIAEIVLLHNKGVASSRL